MLPQTDNCCPTTVYRHLQCMSLLINISGVLRGHTIESFYAWKLCFLLWCLSLFLPLYWSFISVYVRSYTWMWYFINVFVFTLLCPKWHNETVQSIKSSLYTCVPLCFQTIQFCTTQHEMWQEIRIKYLCNDFRYLKTIVDNRVLY